MAPRKKTAPATPEKKEAAKKTHAAKKPATKKAASAAKKPAAKKTTAAQDKLKAENAALKARIKELEKLLNDTVKNINKVL